MATGADDEYWEGQNLPSTFKHTLLDKYVPQFAGMTGSRSFDRRVVFLDGYAGRGRYDDGKSGSAERIMRIAEIQAQRGLKWTCFFVEKDPQSAAVLQGVVNEYRGRGVDARAHEGDVSDVLSDVLKEAAGVPLFLFLDPTGFGMPYDRLVRSLTETRGTAWPPTEVLLNFSLEAVRRTAGHVSSEHGVEASMRRLDAAVGGPWWRSPFRSGYTDQAVALVAREFSSRLASSTSMNVVSVPVTRAPGHKPLYHLVFGTRKQHGLWAFGDSVARATEAWWDTLEEVEASADPGVLFGVAETIRPKLETVESQAVPVIAENLAALLDEVPSFSTVERTLRIFGDYYGQVREPTVRQAVRRLYAEGRTGCDGKGGKPRDLVVTRL